MSKIISADLNHKPDCHPKTEKSIQYREVSKGVKRKAAEDPSDPPDMVVTKSLRKQDPDDKDCLGSKDVSLLKQIVYYERNKSVPHKLPKNLDQLFDQMDDVKDRESFRTHGEQFLFPFPAFHMLFITTVTNLMFLCDSANEHYLADGTFSYCPHLFDQLYTIMIYRAGHYIPLVHVGLPGKSEVIYTQMWTLLKELCMTLCDKVLDINHLLVDYEKAAINSAYLNFPSIIITGCRFHLSQAWFRWIQRYKGFDYLSHYLDNTSEIGKWLRIIFGLSFLPPHMIEEAFLLLQELKPSSECDVFSDYIFDNYIGHLGLADFPPDLWAREVKDSRDVRTTNGPESFHMNYNAYFKAKHPSIYKVVFALLLMQEKRYLAFNDIKSGISKPQSNPQIIKDEKVREC